MQLASASRQQAAGYVGHSGEAQQCMLQALALQNNVLRLVAFFWLKKRGWGFMPADAKPHSCTLC